MGDARMSQLHSLIKQAALKAVEASAPAGVFYGVVTDTSPLTVQMEQRLTLDAEFLSLSSLVRDFEVEMTAGGESRAYKVRLGLEKGEKVMLLRVQGGQRYIVLDRVR